jgi:hypothetical protein
MNFPVFSQKAIPGSGLQEATDCFQRKQDRATADKECVAMGRPDGERTRLAVVGLFKSS